MSEKQRRQFLKNFGALGIGLLAGKVAMAEGDELDQNGWILWQTYIHQHG